MKERSMEHAAETMEEARAHHAARVTRWQHAQKAAGQCRCGAPIAAGSEGRCPGCLEKGRRDQRRRRGVPLARRAGRKRRGRPFIGNLRERWKAFEQEEMRSQRAAVRAVERRELYASPFVIKWQAGCVLSFDRATNLYVWTRVYR